MRLFIVEIDLELQFAPPFHRAVTSHRRDESDARGRYSVRASYRFTSLSTHVFKTQILQCYTNVLNSSPHSETIHSQKNIKAAQLLILNDCFEESLQSVVWCIRSDNNNKTKQTSWGTRYLSLWHSSQLIDVQIKSESTESSWSIDFTLEKQALPLTLMTEQREARFAELDAVSPSTALLPRHPHRWSPKASDTTLCTHELHVDYTCSACM